jgi:hypothetical protein
MKDIGHLLFSKKLLNEYQVKRCVGASGKNGIVEMTFRIIESVFDGATINGRSG